MGHTVRRYGGAAREKSRERAESVSASAETYVCHRVAAVVSEPGDGAESAGPFDGEHNGHLHASR